MNWNTWKTTITNKIHFYVWKQLWKNTFLNKKDVIEFFLKEWVDYQMIMLTLRNIEDSWAIEEYHKWIYVESWNKLFLKDNDVINFVKLYRKDARLTWLTQLKHSWILYRKRNLSHVFLTLWKSESFFLKSFDWWDHFVKLIQVNEEEYELFNYFSNELWIETYINEKCYLDSLKYESINIEFKDFNNWELDIDIIEELKEWWFIEKFYWDEVERLHQWNLNWDFID